MKSVIPNGSLRQGITVCRCIGIMHCKDHAKMKKLPGAKMIKTLKAANHKKWILWIVSWISISCNPNMSSGGWTLYTTLIVIWCVMYTSNSTLHTANCTQLIILQMMGVTWRGDHLHWRMHNVHCTSEIKIKLECLPAVVITQIFHLNGEFFHKHYFGFLSFFLYFFSSWKMRPLHIPIWW